MAYSTTADVQAEFKSVTFGAGTTPTSTQVDGFISEADAEINARVGLKYTTPVTGAESLKILKTISVGLVAGRIQRILETKQATPELANQDTQVKDLAKEARSKLKEIVAGTLPLPDATLVSTDGDGVKSSNYSAGVEHKFERDTDQW